MESGDIAPLSRLSGLKDLYLGYTAVADASPLRTLDGLRWLQLAGAEANASSIARLQAALPSCVIGTN